MSEAKRDSAVLRGAKTLGQTLKQGAASVPVLASIASHIDDRLSEARIQRIRSMFSVLESRVRVLESRVVESTNLPDEVLDVVVAASEAAMRSREERKHRAAANIIANALLRADDFEKVGLSELEFFAATLRDLSPGAIELLAVAYKRSTKEARRTTDAVWSCVFRDLRAEFSTIDHDLLMGFAQELHGAHLFHMRGGGPVAEQEYANYPIALTNLGLRFAQHLLAPDADQG